jgi:hypothetical protein
MWIQERADEDARAAVPMTTRKTQSSGKNLSASLNEI